MSDTASARRFGTTFFGRRESNAPLTKFGPLGDGAIGLTKVLIVQLIPVAPLLPMMVRAIMRFAGREYAAR